MMSAAVRALAVVALLLAAGSAYAQQGMGSIRPGMTEQQVRDVFGNPDNRSSRNQFTYYFYENNCQIDCGMADLVIFQGGQVVDAVLRAPWRDYDGESSSPKGTAPRATPMQLGLPQAQPQVQGVEVRPAVQPQPAVQPPPPPDTTDTTASDSTSSNGG